MTRRLHPRSRTRFAGAIAFGTRGSRHNDLGETVDALGRAAEQLGLFVGRGACGQEGTDARAKIAGREFSTEAISASTSVSGFGLMAVM